jgi:hypothetical protein
MFGCGVSRAFGEWPAALFSRGDQPRVIARSSVEKKRAADLGDPWETLGMIQLAFLKDQRGASMNRVSVTSGHVAIPQAFRNAGGWCYTNFGRNLGDM